MVAVQVLIPVVVSVGIALFARRTARKVAAETRAAARYERALESLATSLTVDLARHRMETGRALNRVAVAERESAVAYEVVNEVTYNLTLTANLLKTVIRYQVLRVNDQVTSDLYDALMEVIFDEAAGTGLARRAAHGEQIRQMPGEDELVALVIHVESLLRSL